MTDCPLCPGTTRSDEYTLLGMPVCARCARRYGLNWSGMYVLNTQADPGAVAWAIQVRRRKLEHMVSVRVARRLVLAEHLGLEVDVDDLLLLDGRLPWTT